MPAALKAGGSDAEIRSAAFPVGRASGAAGVTRVSRLCGIRATPVGKPDAAYLPVPQEVDFEGPYGQVVHALLYPPANPDVTGPDGARPPYVVWVHGGWTSISVDGESSS